MVRFCFIVIFLSLIAGCAQSPLHTNVPQELTNQVHPLNNPDIRVWGDTTSKERMVKVAAKLASASSDSADKNILALSGGGANGAFGAGILSAWSQTGKRPDFDIVTGVSTGAIISVFAFLGSEYDYEIIDFYTNSSDEDLYSKKSIFSIINSTSVLDIEPFENMVRETITPELLEKVAWKHSNGKTLLIGTTNLDSQRLSVWNMGEIASIGTKESEALFESIILASTAVPGAMPAVQINVQHEDQIYQEVHVDGGVARQVFLFPDSWDIASLAQREINHETNIYVIRNGEFLPKWSKTEMTLPHVASRSLDTIIKYQGRSDVMQIYLQAIEAGAKFHFSHIGDGFNVQKDPSLQFDKVYMRALYEYGLEQTRKEQVWHSEPPTFRTQGAE